MRKFIFLLLVLFSFTKASHAHYFSESYSNWSIIDNEVSATFTILKLEATRVLQIDNFQELGKENELSEGEVFLEYFKSRISVLNSGNQCSLKKQATLVDGKKEYHTIEFMYLCDSTDSIKIVNNVLFDIAQSHVHLSRIKKDNKIFEKALFYNDQTILLDKIDQDEEESFFSNLSSFIYSGIIHILTGLDHLIFLIGLFILVNSFKHLLLVITGFTIGHSITLALVALDIVMPNTLMIEALIGFTIIFISAEYMIKDSKLSNRIVSVLVSILVLIGLSSLVLEIPISLITSFALILITIGYFGIIKSIKNYGMLRIIITSLFGLIHGFGFGVFLFNSEFSQSNVLSALFGFNIGVEIGQIILLLVLIGLSSFFLKVLNSEKYEYLLKYSMVLVSSMGFYWFIQRLYF
jgi:hypothetical protein